jgi:hypothetical protein
MSNQSFPNVGLWSGYIRNLGWKVGEQIEIQERRKNYRQRTLRRYHLTLQYVGGRVAVVHCKRVDLPNQELVEIVFVADDVHIPAKGTVEHLLWGGVLRGTYAF